MKRLFLSAAVASLFVVTAAQAQETAPPAPVPPAPAPAAPPPAPPPSTSQRDLSRAAKLLQITTDNVGDRRDATILIGVSTGIVFLPTGIALDTRHDEVARTVGLGLIGGAGSSLLVAAYSLRTSPIERLRDGFQQRMSAGMPADQLLRLTESEWSDAARTAERRRQTAGTIETIAGGVVALVGTVFLLSPRFFSDQNVQYRVGSLLVGTGLPFFNFGIHTLFQKSAEEIGWEAYQAGSSTTASRGLFTF